MLKMVSTEPITPAEAKMHLRLDDVPGDSVEDTLISDLIATAREYCEKYTGKTFAGKIYEYYLEDFDAEIELPDGPVDSVISVIYTEYDDEDEIETVIDKSGYELDDNKLKPVAGQPWPVLLPGPDKPIKITYKTGTVPMAVKQAMLLLIGFWHSNREAVLDVTNKSVYAVQIPFSVKNLLDQYRDRWWDK